MPHTFSRLIYHVVFGTKRRAPSIDEALRERLWPYLGGIVRDLRGIPLAINGVSDHAHLLVVLPPTISVADFARMIKSNSSKWIHETFETRPHFEWQTGYAAFTVSESQHELVARYIAHQEEHHRTMTFADELAALLRRHGISSEIEDDE